jgi:putative transposase
MLLNYGRLSQSRPPVINCARFVFSTKYRKPVLRGSIVLEVRELIREICLSNEIEIVRGYSSGACARGARRTAPSGSERDAGHQGQTSHHLLMDRRKLRERFWGRHLWARGYFVPTRGNVADQTAAEYIRLQGAEPRTRKLSSCRVASQHQATSVDAESLALK